MSPLRERPPQRQSTPIARTGEARSLREAGDAPIDRGHLSRYTLGSLTLEREILGLFAAQLPLSIEQLRFAATDREWQIAAHTIKGSARAVGAWEVARLALAAEQTSGVADDAARERLLAALEEAFEHVQDYILAAFAPEIPRA